MKNYCLLRENEDFKFYSESNIKYLEEIANDMKNGTAKYEEYELIEDEK